MWLLGGRNSHQVPSMCLRFCFALFLFCMMAHRKSSQYYGTLVTNGKAESSFQDGLQRNAVIGLCHQLKTNCVQGMFCIFIQIKSKQMSVLMSSGGFQGVNESKAVHTALCCSLWNSQVLDKQRSIWKKVRPKVDLKDQCNFLKQTFTPSNFIGFECLTFQSFLQSDSSKAETRLSLLITHVSFELNVLQEQGGTQLKTIQCLYSIKSYNPVLSNSL